MVKRYFVGNLFVLLILLVGTPARAQDAFEPNESFFEAKEIVINQSIQATISEIDDQDFYVFNTAQGGIIELSMAAHPTIDLSIELYDEMQNFVVGTDNNVNVPISFIWLIDDGTYYLRINERGLGTVSSTDPYTFSVFMDPSDPFEINNTFQAAALINGNEEITGTFRTIGDRDYFEFEVVEPGMVRLVILDVPPPVDIDAFFYNETQQQVNFVDGGIGRAVDVTFEIEEAGVHYMMLKDGFTADRFDNGFGEGVYRLTLSGEGLATNIVSVLGDVGANSIVDAGDASVVLQHVVGLISLNNRQQATADVDNNELVQAADAALILQYVVGLITEFPGNTAGKNDGDSGVLTWGDPVRSGQNEWRVPLEIDPGTHPVTSIETTVTFDPSMMHLDAFESALPPDWFVVVGEEEAGILRIAMAGATPLSRADVGAIRATTTGSQGEIVLAGTGLLNTEQPQPLGDAVLAEVPVQYALSQNYPNPFNPITRIEYALPEASPVRLSIFNMLGQEIAVLISEDQPAGVFEVSWDATGLSSGMYMYRLEAGSFVQTRVLTVLK
ncbi:MAG: T9SS type A sorting domain-containing protein [Rhodothermaceae bacterium]|nr:T9SS type A sorting domain-containing protein [Rhodothermaceae bacterium]